MELNSESWKAVNCSILVVQNKSQNLMSRDIFAKLGQTLMQQQTNRSKKNYNIIKNHREQHITKNPQFCIRLAKKSYCQIPILNRKKNHTTQRTQYQYI